MSKHLFQIRIFGMFVTAITFMATLVRASAADQPNDSTNENFPTVSEAVVKLLETGDVSAFSKALSPSAEDWLSANATNRASQVAIDRGRLKLESDARALLARAKELKIDFSKMKLTAESKSQQRLTTIRYNQGATLSYAEQVAVSVSARASTDDAATKRMEGEYKLALKRVVKFQGSWRCVDGILWTSFPNGIVDENSQREIAILAKAANYKGFALAEDPPMGKLAEVLGEFIRERDIKIFETKAIMDVDTVLHLWKKQAAKDEKAPPRAEIEKEWKENKEDAVKPARAVLAALEQGGVNLKGATMKVKAAEFGSSYPRSGAGIIDGLEGNHLRVVFDVHSDAKSKTGKSLSGEYELGAEECVRVDGKWFVSQNLHWIKFPADVLDEKAVAAIEFENYVAENNTLPPGMTAPDIEFVRMSDDKKMKLADLRGKVVVLDFWDTGCGPCQQPLADLQKLKSSHPAWGDRVAIITLSIDGTMKKARNHMESRGWTNTFNTWAGPGGWKAGPPSQFRVTGIPTTYIIDPNGKIIEAGHPVGMQIPEHVDELLASAGQK